MEYEELRQKVTDLDVRLARLEVITEHRAESDMEKHKEVIKAIEALQSVQTWGNRLVMTGFFSILVTGITLALKGKGL